MQRFATASRVFRSTIYCTFLIAAPVHAEDGKGTLSISLDNDLFGAGSDSHYTHGTEITYVSNTYQPPYIEDMAKATGIHSDGDDLRFGISLGQLMFTPDDISRTDPILDDRPYAGWLYLSGGMYSESRRGGIRSIDKLELIIGVVGPESRADQMQKAVHEVTDSEEPMGWENQLDNEATIDVAYQHEWVLPIVDNHVDIIPMVAATLGTSQRYAATGFTMRFGRGLDADSGPPLIRPTASASQYCQPRQNFYVSVFAGAHGRYVGHSIFLDGNRNGDSLSVDKKEWVGEGQAGLVLGWSNWRVALTEIY